MLRRALISRCDLLDHGQLFSPIGLRVYLQKHRDVYHGGGGEGVGGDSKREGIAYVNIGI